MKKYNYGISVVFLALAGYVFWTTRDFAKEVSGTPGAGFWPNILAGFLIVLSIALIIQTALDKKEEDNRPPIQWKSEGMKQVYKAFGLIIGFAVLVKVLGLLIALILFIPALMYLLGERRKKWMVIFPLGIAAFVYVFFAVLLRLSLPAPFFM